MISKRPTNNFYAEVRGTATNYDRTLLEAAMSGPITEGLRFRVAGNWEKQREGYFNNVVVGLPDEGNVIDQLYGEFQLEFDIGERLDGWFKVAAARWDNGGGGPGARANYSPGPYNVNAQYGALNLTSVYGYSGRVTNVVNNGVLSNPATNDPRDFAPTPPARSSWTAPTSSPPSGPITLTSSTSATSAAAAPTATP